MPKTNHMTTETTTTKKVNYLNNKDILKEIHDSKTSYCSFSDNEYHRYDYIIDLPSEPLEKSFDMIFSVIQQAKEARANRLSLETKTLITADSILATDLIFRVMTWDHVPLSLKQTKKAIKTRAVKDIIDLDDSEDEIFEELEDVTTKNEVDDMVHEKVNFPPFQHFKINEQNSLCCVGKSHWQGDLITGSFSKDHGKITSKLAKMYIMLCEKYSMKFNWRGYTYVDEMKASAILQLTYVGLRFNEAKSANPFAYYTAAITNSFCRVLNTEKKNQNIRDDILEINGLAPSWSRQNASSSTYDE